MPDLHVVRDAVAQEESDGQLTWPWWFDREKLTEFLTAYCALENEQDRLREQLRELCEDAKELLPLRAVRTAVKIVRATRKLAHHPTEGMIPERLALLTAEVEAHLTRLDEETARAVGEGQ